MIESSGRRERRARRSRNRTLAMVGAVALIAVTVGAVIALSGGEEPKKRATPRTTTTTLPPPDPDAGPFGIATIAVDELPIYAQPDATGEPIETLDPRSDYGLPTTLAMDINQAPVDGWVPVTIPLKKPNGQSGWVEASKVTVSSTTYLVKVDLSDHEVVLLNSGEEMLRAKVIIGTPYTATPVGRFYVTDPVNCNTERIPGYPVAQCDGAYGEFAMGTSGLSDILDTFAGTIPQIALHGTSLPDTELGKDLSNGCVRMQNTVILEIAKTVPLGTPVVITA